MNNYKDDMHYIRQMMEKSSSFISLSGWSGISTGIIALISSGLCYNLMNRYQINYFDGRANIYPNELLFNLIMLAVTTFVSALIFSYYFTYKKAQKQNISLWTNVSKYLLIQMAIPLICGGLFCLLLICYGLFFLVAPLTLLFYGLSLVAGSKYVNLEVFWLGISEIILGFIGLVFPGYGLILWTIGFGIIHIIYGAILQNKYK